MSYYPVLLDLKNKKAVVAGGGSVAERKVRTLLRSGASVRVISPKLTGNLRALRDRKLITHTVRGYRKGDAGSAFLVVAATSSDRVNALIAKDAKHLVNVVTSPDRGNFIVPSSVKRGQLTISISTEGASPAISRMIRKEIEQLYGAEFARYLKFTESMRKKAMRMISDPVRRGKFLRSLASKKIFSAIRNKGFSRISKDISARLTAGH